MSGVHIIFQWRLFFIYLFWLLYFDLMLWDMLFPWKARRAHDSHTWYARRLLQPVGFWDQFLDSGGSKRQTLGSQCIRGSMPLILLTSRSQEKRKKRKLCQRWKVYLDCHGRIWHSRICRLREFTEKGGGVVLRERWGGVSDSTLRVCYRTLRHRHAPETVHLETWELRWRLGLVLPGRREGKENADLCDSDFPLFAAFQNRGHSLRSLAPVLA